jgi:hypothetical protein
MFATGLCITITAELPGLFRTRMDMLRNRADVIRQMRALASVANRQSLVRTLKTFEQLDPLFSLLVNPHLAHCAHGLGQIGFFG